MSKKSDELRPRDIEVAKAYIEEACNVSAVARRVGITRQTVSKIIDKQQVREEITRQMEIKGLGTECIADKMNEGMNATSPFYNPRTGEMMYVPDYKTRHLYLTTALKLNKVDLSGQEGTATEDHLEITDDELLDIIKAKDADIKQIE